MLIGGWIMALGQMLLFVTEYWGYGKDVEVVLLSTAPLPFLTFMLGLVLIVLGTGMFKPCVSVMVGQLYGADDPRRDSGFTIFYMGINVGAFLSTLVAGTIGETFGWHWGFISAAVGMVLGLTVYQLVRPYYLKGIGLPPRRNAASDEGREPTPEEARQAEINHYEQTRPLTRVDWDRMIVIVVLAVFGIVFWVAFEQAASSLNLFALNRTNRNVLGFEFPATWYQSVNPLAIVMLAPLFAGLWGWLDRRGMQPSTPVKLGIGLALLSLSYVPMLIASHEAGNPTPIRLADAPAPIQRALQPVRERLVKERTEAKQKEKAQREEEEKNGTPVWKKFALWLSGEIDTSDDDSVFDVFERLEGRGSTYYAVGYGDKKSYVYELLDAEGNVVRRRASRKPSGDDAEAKLEKVKGAVPRDTKLDEVPEAVRETILAQAGDRPIDSLQSTLVARMPIAELVTKEDGKKAIHQLNIHDYTATWNDADGEVQIRVDTGGFLVAKDNAVIRLVGLAGPQWLLLAYVLATCGELAISPVSLSMVTKLSPARYTSAMMGLFFVTYSIANFIAHTLAAYSSEIATGKWFSILGGQIDFFLILTIAPLIVSIMVFLISPSIKRMMHGLN